MLLRYLVAELLKLRRSLGLLLCFAAPSCVVALLGFGWLMAEEPGMLGEFALGAASLWGFAMVPLAITALGVLLAQIEHGPRTWLYLLTLPGARPHVFLSKALVMIGLVAAMTAVLWVEIVAGAAIIGALRADVTGSFGVVGLAGLLVRMVGAAMLVAMLQLWAALRFRSFVPPLVLGIAGTFVAFAASSRDFGIYFPWLMPGKIMSAPEQVQVPLLLGGVGGVVAMLALVVDLSRREA